jgi:thiol-disulfide isomerase/thioredoxin
MTPDRTSKEVPGTEESTAVLGSDDSTYFLKGYNYETPDNSLFSFKSHQGKTILIDFWATWCKPCIQNHPRVEDLYHEVNHPDFLVINASIDKDMEAWRSFVKKNHWQGIHIHIPYTLEDPLFKMVANQFKNNAGEKLISVTVPQYFLIDKQLEVTGINDIHSDEVVEQIRRAIK